MADHALVRPGSPLVTRVALATPLVLVLGWLIAGLMAARSYSPVYGTLSDLAAQGRGAPVMTTAFGLTASCLVFLGVVARRLGLATRVLLLVAAVGVVVVTVAPVGTAPVVHSAAAFVALVALSVAPLVVRGGGRRRFGLAALCWVLTFWTVVRPDLAAGAVERVLTTVELVWLAVAVRDAR